MKAVICTLLASISYAWAYGVADRAAIEHVIGSLNAGYEKPHSVLFTADAENEVDRLASLDRWLLERSNEPWSEVTTPRLVIQSVRFVTPDVALVDAANTHYGSTILARRIPVLFVMKKEGTVWRISSLRVLVDIVSLP
jgi:hypothetical protein